MSSRAALLDGELESADDHGRDEGGSETQSEQGMEKTDCGSKVLQGDGATLLNESGDAGGDFVRGPVDGEDTSGVCDGPSAGFDAIGQFSDSLYHAV